MNTKKIDNNRNNQNEVTAQRNHIIDFARIVFYMFIVVAHTRYIAQSTEPPKTFLPTAALGVEFFFIVTGYLMAAKAFKTECDATNIGTKTIKFVIKKFSSIFSMYLFTYAICFVLKNIGKPIKEIANLLLLTLVSFFQLDIFGFDGYQVIHVTWFLGAMFASILLLYPVLLKNKNLFCNLISLILALFIYGWIAKEYGCLPHIYKWRGIVYVGLLRGLAGISLGCFCYVVSKKLKSFNLRRSVRIVISIIEILGYVYAWISMGIRAESKFDFITVAFIAVSITLSFSEQGLLTQITNALINRNQLCRRGLIGKISMALFFADVPSRMITTLVLPNSNWNMRFPFDMIVLVCLSIVLIAIATVAPKIKRRIHIIVRSGGTNESS